MRETTIVIRIGLSLETIFCVLRFRPDLVRPPGGLPRRLPTVSVKTCQRLHRYH
jgi:hypothetical protein